MAGLLARFLHDPAGLVARGFRKLVVGPLRYRRGRGYDAERYWGDRFRRYGRSLRGPGHEGYSEEENARVYAQARAVVLEACRRAGVRFPGARVLEIGVGTGFYTRMCRDEGARSYTGVDVTDALFGELRREFPEYEFVRRDATAETIEGEYDLVLMIDVVEHIVTEEGLAAALGSVRGALAPGGVFLLALPAPGSGAERLFYLHAWRLEEVLRHLEGLETSPPEPFRYGMLLTARRPAATPGA
jgi:SAM-dependent methyltransferase